MFAGAAQMVNGVGRTALFVSMTIVSASTLVGEVQLTVSPGHPSQLVRTWDACPTFSWASVSSAMGSELVVYRLRGEGVDERPTLRQAFPGLADSWTPPLDRCLERGGRYAWSVRSLGLDPPSSWSPPRLFEVAAGPSFTELEAALAVIRRHLDRREETSTSGGVGPEAAGEKARTTGCQETASPLEPAGATETLLSVDGGVGASAFSGDGSILTGLDPASFTSGVADIDITGSSSLVNCVGCVDSIHIGWGQVQSIDIADGEVTGADIDPSTVQKRVSGSCAPGGGVGAVGSDGSPTCTTLTQVSRGEEYLVSSLGGQGSKIKLAPFENRICLLTFVGVEDLDVDFGFCRIYQYEDPTTGGQFWVLEAKTSGAADALCGMRCMEISPNRVSGLQKPTQEESAHAESN